MPFNINVLTFYSGAPPDKEFHKSSLLKLEQKETSRSLKNSCSWTHLHVSILFVTLNSTSNTMEKWIDVKTSNVGQF